ncbi:MAG: patatin-like protein [Sphingomonadaceae bacterium]|nr:patatin-like protein [Sphingomonadaceae bacterium]
MREKELRLALVCYGGISLAVYMHGITKEIWRLARASRDFHEGATGAAGSQAVYRALLETIEAETGIRLRALVDIVTGASAGGINGIFLANAIASGRSLEPLTELWLERADVDVLLAPDRRPLTRATKFWAAPVAWMISRSPGNTIDATVAPETREEVRAKLSRFVRAKWFQPPFGGPGFTHLILDALGAMAATPAEGALLPPGQPLDLFVTVTDFHGHPERLRLNSPPEVVETEHRLILAFSDHGRDPRAIGEEPELAFAARATASFPGAFPPFSVGELDAALAERGEPWPGRDAFLARALPHHHAVGMAEQAVLIDGSVLANAPFGPAIAALRDRPARREVDRRFVYIDPRPGAHSIGLGEGKGEPPGFFRTIFGAMSDIPREQPIRDNLEAIERHSARIAAMRRLIEAIRPEVEAAIAGAFDRTLFLTRPTPARLAAWRRKAQTLAARRAGYAYVSYGHLKLAGIVEEAATVLAALTGAPDPHATERLRGALREAVHAMALDAPGALSAEGASDSAVEFFRAHDLMFRVRRLRFVLRRLVEIGEGGTCPAPAIEAARDAIYAALAGHLDRQRADFYGKPLRKLAAFAERDAVSALAALGSARDGQHRHRGPRLDAA